MRDNGLGSSNLPLHVCDAHFLARLFVIVKPLAIAQIDAGELSDRLGALCLEVALGRELCELEPPAIELEYVDRLGGICPLICGRRGLDARRMFSLTVFAPPDKVGLALAAADFVLLEAVEGDVVGVRLAT